MQGRSSRLRRVIDSLSGQNFYASSLSSHPMSSLGLSLSLSLPDRSDFSKMPPLFWESPSALGGGDL